MLKLPSVNINLPCFLLFLPELCWWIHKIHDFYLLSGLFHLLVWNIPFCFVYWFVCFFLTLSSTLRLILICLFLYYFLLICLSPTSVLCSDEPSLDRLYSNLLSLSITSVLWLLILYCFLTSHYSSVSCFAYGLPPAWPC